MKESVAGLLEGRCAPVGECLIWTAKTSSSRLVETVKVDGVACKPCRAVYLLEHGPLEKGWYVHQICGNTLCVNPDHLFINDSRNDVYPTPADRFWSKVEKSEGCWLWKGPKAMDGYGAFAVKRKNYRAHRYAYEQANGAIPEGLVICHKCDTPLCVNPDHLFAGTVQDNVTDCRLKGRARVASGDNHYQRKRKLARLAAEKEKNAV